MPYGRDKTLPYIKQYYVGGPYSLRGWRVRSLGPGSSFNEETKKSANALDLTGDIKIECSGEYRFTMLPLFAGAIKMNGALFADAGNIWLTNPNDAYPNGSFELERLGKDLAIDMGVGTRFDIASFFTVRIDFAIPVKKPYLPYIAENNGWVFHQIALGDGSWRADNVILNFSIGYPF